MKALVMVLCAAAGLVAAASQTQAQDGIKLRYQLKKGEPYVYRKANLIKQVQTIQEKDKTNKVETVIKNDSVDTWTLKEVDAKDNLHVQTENNSLTAKMSIEVETKDSDGKTDTKKLGELNFDSKNKAKNKNTLPGADPNLLFERLAGSKLTLVVTPQGRANAS